MRPILVKAYGNLHPVERACFEEAEHILEAWGISDAVFYEGDMVRFSFEGDYFPCDEIAQLLKKFHTIHTEGKLDCMNLEDWLLTRHFFKENGEYHTNTATLNKALDKQFN